MGIVDGALVAFVAGAPVDVEVTVAIGDMVAFNAYKHSLHCQVSLSLSYCIMHDVS